MKDLSRPTIAPGSTFLNGSNCVSAEALSLTRGAVRGSPELAMAETCGPSGVPWNWTLNTLGGEWKPSEKVVPETLSTLTITSASMVPLLVAVGEGVAEVEMGIV